MEDPNYTDENYGQVSQQYNEGSPQYAGKADTLSLMSSQVLPEEEPKVQPVSTDSHDKKIFVYPQEPTPSPHESEHNERSKLVENNTQESFLNIQAKPMTSIGEVESYGDSEPSFPDYYQEPSFSSLQIKPISYSKERHTPDTQQSYFPETQPPYSTDNIKPYSEDPNEFYSPNQDQYYSPNQDQYYSPNPNEFPSADSNYAYSPGSNEYYPPDDYGLHSSENTQQYPSFPQGEDEYSPRRTDEYGTPYDSWSSREPWYNEEGYTWHGHGYDESLRSSFEYYPQDFEVMPESKESSISDSVSFMSGRCKEFHLKELADHLVKGTLKSAIESMKVQENQDWGYFTKGTEGPNIEWPTNYEFTLAVGERKINEFLNTWNITSAWYHCVEFVSSESDLYACYYNYEAKWSIPTAPYPIPQATVSVFFKIEVSRIKPEDCPVIVSFQFETDPFIHKPGECKICEEWINDTLHRKVEFFKSLTF